jgi:hypothetical protein
MLLCGFCLQLVTGISILTLAALITYIYAFRKQPVTRAAEKAWWKAFHARSIAQR